ncbi:unnamed protein product [Paramecium sonneborni]|uniref:Uncharacterized protein n=1 Tax=Paramecium sonneborni TaxID=65129 RepID=A0A8S1RSX4_9CILI|nr:unnamed protein product [Paramecium sonneborni]
MLSEVEYIIYQKFHINLIGSNIKRFLTIVVYGHWNKIVIAEMVQKHHIYCALILFFILLCLFLIILI